MFDSLDNKNTLDSTREGGDQLYQLAYDENNSDNANFVADISANGEAIRRCDMLWFTLICKLDFLLQ